jgi:hypothetical protein
LGYCSKIEKKNKMRVFSCRDYVFEGFYLAIKGAMFFYAVYAPYSMK